MKGTEDVANGRHVDPFVSVQAEKMLTGAFFVLPVHDEVASGNSEHGQTTENNVSPEEELALFVEQFPVELQLVLLEIGQQGPIFDHVVIESKIDIVSLVNEDYDHERNKVERVDLFMAILHEERRDEESECNQVHAPAENLV